MINLDTKISELTELQLQTTTDYQDPQNQQAEDTKQINENIQNLTAKISTLTKDIGSQHGQFVKGFQSIRYHINNATYQQNEKNKNNNKKLEEKFMMETFSLQQDIGSAIQ